MNRLAALLLAVAVAAPLALAGTTPALGLTESPDRPTSDEVVGNAPNGFAACDSVSRGGAIIISDDPGCDAASADSVTTAGSTETCDFDVWSGCLGSF